MIEDTKPVQSAAIYSAVFVLCMLVMAYCLGRSVGYRNGAEAAIELMTDNRKQHQELSALDCQAVLSTLRVAYVDSCTTVLEEYVSTCPCAKGIGL